VVMVDRIIELARECLGTPFKHQGRTAGIALDCAGVVAHVLKGLGLPYLDNKGYPRRPFDGLLNKALNEEPSLRLIDRTEIAPGDVVVFRIKRAPQHLAIYCGDTIIHAYSDTGRVVEQSYSAWKSKVTSVYRIVT